jgi:hypothetical protein
MLTCLIKFLFALNPHPQKGTKKHEKGFKGSRGQGPQGGVNGMGVKTLKSLNPKALFSNLINSK